MSTLTNKDATGNTIQAGNFLVYFTRQGSTMKRALGLVLEVNANNLKVRAVDAAYNHNLGKLKREHVREVRLNSGKNSVLVPVEAVEASVRTLLDPTGLSLNADQ